MKILLIIVGVACLILGLLGCVTPQSSSDQQSIFTWAPQQDKLVKQLTEIMINLNPHDPDAQLNEMYDIVMEIDHLA